MFPPVERILLVAQANNRTTGDPHVSHLPHVNFGRIRPSRQAIWPWWASVSSLRGESTTGTAYLFPPHPRRLGRLQRWRQALGIESESNTKYGVALENSGDESRGRVQVSGIQGRFGSGPVDRFAMKNSCECHAAWRWLLR